MGARCDWTAPHQDTSIVFSLGSCNYDITNSTSDKSIDILIYGNGEQRHNLYLFLKKIFDNDSRNIKIVYHENLFNDDLFNTLKITKIVINKNYFNNGLFPQHRLSEALSCGCIFLTDDSNCPQVFIKDIYRDLDTIYLNNNDLVIKINKILENYNNYINRYRDICNNLKNRNDSTLIEILDNLQL